jgi:3-deoxy-manno-octulosonate cytidylyltransferase (CMP-KDO synthetase)
MSSPKVIGIIPARWHSTRFPGKPLAKINNKPLIQWVYEGAKSARELTELFVATDDERILKTVQEFGGNAVMTSKQAKTGSDRALEALNHPQLQDASIIINIQGDEPLIQGPLIDDLANYLKNNPDIPVVSAIKKLNGLPSPDPNIVKVVAGKIKDKEIALYFSRAAIPFYRNPYQGDSFYLRHIGIYGFQKNALAEFTQLRKSSLEEAESLEQLRMIENGWLIGLVYTDYEALGVDTPEDIILVENAFKLK